MYIVFYQWKPIEYFTHLIGTVDQYSAKIEHNSECTIGMALAHLRMLNNKFRNKDPYVVPEQSIIIILDIKPYLCMAKNRTKKKH